MPRRSRRSRESEKSYEDVEKSTEEVVKELDFDLDEQDDDLIPGGNNGEFFSLEDIKEETGNSLIFELPQDFSKDSFYMKTFQDTGHQFETLQVPKAALIKGNRVLRTWIDLELSVKTVLKNKLVGSNKSYKGKNQEAVLKDNEYYVRIANAKQKKMQGNRNSWYWVHDVGFGGEGHLYEKILLQAFDD